MRSFVTPIQLLSVLKYSHPWGDMCGVLGKNHPAIVLFLVLGVQGTSSLLRQFTHLLSVTGFRHSVSHRHMKTRQLFSLIPVTNKQTTGKTSSWPS